MSFRLSVDLAAQRRKGNIHDSRLRLAEHLASANLAEASCGLFRTLETLDVLLSRRNRELLDGNRCPGNETGTMGSPAHRAVAVPTE